MCHQEIFHLSNHICLIDKQTIIFLFQIIAIYSAYHRSELNIVLETRSIYLNFVQGDQLYYHFLKRYGQPKLKIGFEFWKFSAFPQLRPHNFITNRFINKILGHNFLNTFAFCINMLFALYLLPESHDKIILSNVYIVARENLLLLR